MEEVNSPVKITTPIVSPKVMVNSPKPAQATQQQPKSQDIDLLFDLNPADNQQSFVAPISNSSQKASADLDFFNFEPSVKPIPASVTMPNLQSNVSLPYKKVSFSTKSN